MPLLNELQEQTNAIVLGHWDRRAGDLVPETEAVDVGDEPVDLDATFLYADLVNSKDLAVYDRVKAAEVIKAYLMGTASIIKSLGGEFRSFDGERVMGVFLGNRKNTDATDAALKINYFFSNVLKPVFVRVYSDTFSGKFDLNQTIGIDTSQVMAMRSGIRDNDVVWIGRAPNAAAKLSAMREGYQTYITQTVFDAVHDHSKYGGNPSRMMWESRMWDPGVAFGVQKVYRSNWSRKP